MPKTTFKESLIKNQVALDMYVERLINIALSCFKWENLPETVDSRYIELMLFTQGQAIFFNDDVAGFLCLACLPGGNFDVYGYPEKRTAKGFNAYQKSNLNNTDSVIIYNNLTHTPSEKIIRQFCERLANIDRTIDVNVNAQKTPTLLTCDESQRLTMKNLYMQYDGNAPVIYGDKNLDINNVQSISTNAEFKGLNLYDLKSKIWNEALTYLGIANLQSQKKERLITDEVNKSLGGTLACRQSRLIERKIACERINKMFGLNIDCVFNDDVLSELGEVGENERIHDGN